ncbi:MAG: hypothetical protein EP330_12715 [Deltaproteobacteria bacterium]|nr:MAG: hypothetical protein EP330_12715 [Deltaproteobacteria bacterium]
MLLLATLALPALAADDPVAHDVFASMGVGSDECSIEGCDPVSYLQVGYSHLRPLEPGGPLSLGYRFDYGLRLSGAAFGTSGPWGHAEFLVDLRPTTKLAPYVTAGLGTAVYVFIPGFPSAALDAGLAVPLGPVWLQLAGRGRAMLAIAAGESLWLEAHGVLSVRWQSASRREKRRNMVTPSSPPPRP